jgi:hypothetical protein
MILLATFAAALGLLASPTNDNPDLLVLKDGKEIECRVLYEGADEVVYRSKKRTRDIARDEVAEIQSIERSLEEFLKMSAEIGEQDVDKLGDLALFAESTFLPGEARNTWLRILTLDPDNERAWTKLGGIMGRKGWMLKVRGRFYTIDQLRERASDWKNALTLSTAHFVIRTDIAPEKALDIALQIEQIYMDYYALLGTELRLFPFEEVPEIHIYSDADDYPSPPTPGRPVWYARNPNEIYIDASGAPDMYQARVNVAYCLLFNSLRRSLDVRSGSLPAWSREGLAQGLAMRTLNEKTGELQAGAANISAFRRVVLDEDVLPLKRIINTGYSAFDGGQRSQRLYDQSYTLTHFLVHGLDEQLRPGFAEYLVGSFKGKTSVSSLEKALGMKMKELEVEWKAYVKAKSGI